MCYPGNVGCQFGKKAAGTGKVRSSVFLASNPHPFSNFFLFPHSSRQEYQKNLSRSCSWQFCRDRQNMLAVGNSSGVCRTGCHLCRNQTEIEIATSVLLSGVSRCSKTAVSASGTLSLYHMGASQHRCGCQMERYRRKNLWSEFPFNRVFPQDISPIVITGKARKLNLF